MTNQAIDYKTLKLFCHPYNEDRFHDPIIFGESIIATDGIIFLYTNKANYAGDISAITDIGADKAKTAIAADQIIEFVEKTQCGDIEIPNAKWIICRECDGAGYFSECHECDGIGEVTARTDYSEYDGLTCNSCDGTGKASHRHSKDILCDKCKGLCRVPEKEVVCIGDANFFVPRLYKIFLLGKQHKFAVTDYQDRKVIVFKNEVANGLCCAMNL